MPPFKITPPPPPPKKKKEKKKKTKQQTKGTLIIVNYSLISTLLYGHLFCLILFLWTGSYGQSVSIEVRNWKSKFETFNLNVNVSLNEFYSHISILQIYNKKRRNCGRNLWNCIVTDAEI